MSERTLVLVDGSSYLYRAYHALPRLTSSRGAPTGALLGVLNMINKLAREEPSPHFAVVFDAPGKTFRDAMFEKYKANRPPMPDELRSQVQPLLAAVEASGLPLLRIEGVEADDVIGTLCRRAVEQNMRVLISTGDKDVAQLVTGGVTVVNTMSGSVLDRDGVKKKFDVYPEQIVDYLALVGDTSDNIPGVPKVGAKTAARWLNQYGSVDEIIRRADEIPGKVGESLREHIENLKRSRELATIKMDVELRDGPDELQRRTPDTERLREIYREYELTSLLKQLEDVPIPEPPGASTPAAPPSARGECDSERGPGWRSPLPTGRCANPPAVVHEKRRCGRRPIHGKCGYAHSSSPDRKFPGNFPDHDAEREWTGPD